MNKACCLAEDIRKINSTKEYVLTSHKILESVLTDKNLNSQSAHLWQILYAKAKYNKELDIKISYTDLSEILGKSKRTIFRYVATLVENGYLILNNNYKNNKSQTINTFYVRFPSEKIQTIANSKNREENQKVNSGKTLKSTSTLSSLEKNSEVINSTNLKNTTKTLEYIQGPLLKTPINPQTNDNIVTGEDDNVVIHKDSNLKIKENNNNNNVVVINSQLEKLKNDLKTASIEKEVLQKDFLKEKNKDVKLEKLKKFGEIETKCILIQTKIDITIKKQMKFNQEEHITSAMINDNTFILKKTGYRAIDEYNFKRLTKSLTILGYTEPELSKLINEVVFEIRFGSLQKTKDMVDLPISHAINIALKLIREKTWNTPTYLNKFLGLTPKKCST